VIVGDPVAVPPGPLLLGLAVGVGVAAVAGLPPAVRAARLTPVEALRSV
jgi:putative ABC transport system permease protein